MCLTEAALQYNVSPEMCVCRADYYHRLPHTHSQAQVDRLGENTEPSLLWSTLMSGGKWS